GDAGRDGAVDMNRRGFLGAGAGSLAAAAILGPAAGVQAQERAKGTGSAILPRRMLGRTGVEVSMLNLGTWRSGGLDRILRFAWANGLGCIDTAASYGSEPSIARWLKGNPEIRKQIFLVTKEHPTTPSKLIAGLDERLETLQTDYADLIFIHALGDRHIETE